MKNLPSFQEFSKYDCLIESASSEQMQALRELATHVSNPNLNEGKILDMVKNNLSKFFLGKFSKIGVIDQAREVLVKLEIDLIEKRNEFENSVDKINQEIDQYRSTGDRQRLIALTKDRESKTKEFENYEKAAKLKIKKAQEIVRDVIDGNPRRRKYYEAGRSEDEIKIAEIQYQMAKDKSEDSEIKKYEEKLRKAKEEAEKKAEDLKAEMEAQEKREKEKKDSEEESRETIELIKMDPEKEKKKISSRKGKDVIERKKELEISIVELKSQLERKLNLLQKRAESGKKITPSYLKNTELEMLSIAATIDAQKNLLTIFRDLGKTENEITKKLLGEKSFTEVTNKINQGISDGQDAGSGLKKEISSIFTGSEGSVNVQKIKDAKEKLDK